MQNPIQQTLVIIKPDGLERGLVGEICRDINRHGLSIVDSARVHLPVEWVEKLYEQEKEAIYYTEVVDWVSSAPVLLLKIQGVDAVDKIKWQIIGRYPEGIRGRYAKNWIQNIAHAADSEDSAKRELQLAQVIFNEVKNMHEMAFKGKMVFALTGMSECGKSTVGKYLDSCGIPRLKIVRLFEQVRDKLAPGVELYEFTKTEESRDPYALWDAFIEELNFEMEVRKVNMVSIESLYGGGLGPYLKARLEDHFCIIYIDIPVEVRLQRQMEREGLETLEEAKHLLIPRDEIKISSGIPDLKKIAGEMIDNSGTPEDLYKVIDGIVSKYRKIA